MTEINEGPGPDDREQDELDQATAGQESASEADDERTVGGSPADELDPPDPQNPTNTDDPG